MKKAKKVAGWRFLGSAALFAGLLLGECPILAQEWDKASGANLLQQAVQAAQQDDSAAAVKTLTTLLKKEPKNSTAWYLRGRENFRLGRIEQSIQDFDRAVELDPKSESRQWERGIAYYYAGEYKKGARQFQDYQSYHDQDVENSAWRYLCVARSKGVEQARSTLLPIENDPRIPMMRIYDLYAGKAQPADVLRAARDGTSSSEALKARLFYAHLYIGLWFEAADDNEQAREHILAAEKHRIGHYMWDVAHVHAERLRQKAKTAAEANRD